MGVNSDITINLEGWLTMGKLNQIIAVVSGKKSQSSEVLTNCYHKIQKTPLFDGISRTYQPKDEDGEKLPSESKSIQVKVGDLVGDVRKSLQEMYNIIATQDHANCRAKADVSVNGKKILTEVPVTHLLFLEKQLTDLTTFVSKLPTLDPAESWSYNEATDYYATPPAETVRTKKVPRAFVKAEATKEHPAQVDVFQEDIVAGYWRTIKYSGAIPASRKNEMLERVRNLHEAVVKAREEANGIEVVDVNVGESILKYVFDGK